MVEWVLVWFLIVEQHNGDIDKRGPFSTPVQTQVECTYEANEKQIELEKQIGSSYYLTENFKSKVSLGGTLMGITVGCRESNK